MDTKQMQRIMKDYYEQIYANKLDNLEKNEYISRKIQPSNTESGRNGKSE